VVVEDYSGRPQIIINSREGEGKEEEEFAFVLVESKLNLN